MRKLNRKGFTLIELLAVIVVLAIVLVVTIPAVLSSMDTARHKSLENAADTVRIWFQNQYDSSELADSDLARVDSTYTTFVGTGLPKVTDGTVAAKQITAANANVLQAAGIGDTTGLTGSVYLSSNNKICVTLTADNTNTKFYVNSSVANYNTVKKGDCL